MHISNEISYCSDSASYALQVTGSTGSLVNHMKRKHASMFNDELFKINSLKVENRLVTKEIFRQKVSQFIFCSDQPFAIVENPFFMDLLDYCSGGTIREKISRNLFGTSFKCDYR